MLRAGRIRPAFQRMAPRPVRPPVRVASVAAAEHAGTGMWPG